jgi:hypothetical protein
LATLAELIAEWGTTFGRMQTAAIKTLSDIEKKR